MKPDKKRNVICRTEKSLPASPIVCYKRKWVGLLFFNIAIFLLQDYMVKMEINSIRLDMKLVFEFIENVGSADINRSPNGNRTPKHGKVLNIYIFFVRWKYFSVAKI